MARVIKEEAYAVKRKEILDAAQRLIYTKGYEQMSIQDILDELKISKGAFYHYFGSKLDLLEAMTEGIIDEVNRVLMPIVEDPNLPALQKLQRYFDTAGRWKADRKDLLLQLVRVWYDDHNAIVRQKTYAAAIRSSTPIIARIIRQGVAEGVFHTDYPDQAGEIIFSLFQSLGDTFLFPIILREDLQASDLTLIKNGLAAYTDALERVLGAPHGSIHLLDDKLLATWFAPSKETAHAHFA
jgi:AcrR family transcriptional regulator